MVLPFRNITKRRTSTFILIGDGFDEYEVIYFIHKFRRQGLSIKSVSLFNKLVFSRQGVGIKADYALSDRPFDAKSDYILILPAGGRNGDKLRRDMRVRMLLERMNSGYGRVILTDGSSQLASDVESVMTDNLSFMSRMDEGFEDFVDSLADQMVYAN